MIKIVQYKRNMKIQEADYVLDKSEKLLDILVNLTPKFEGNWEIVLLEPKIKFVKKLLEDIILPEWVNIYLYLSNKKMEAVVLEHPGLQPKAKSIREEYDTMISSLNHLIDKNAKDAILRAIGNNTTQLQETLTLLDKECEGQKITLKQVQSTLNYSSRVYASDVLKAFMTHDVKRWDLYYKLLHELGPQITYYALYKQVKQLLDDKYAFLHNEDVKSYIARNVDAAFICYVYTIFCNSTDYRQLVALLHMIDNRCEDTLNFIMED